MGKKSVNRITLINVVSTVLLNGIAFFSAPLFSRLLGTEGYGITSVFFIWSSVFSLCFAFQTDATLGMASVRFPQEEQIKYQSSVLGFSLLVHILASAAIVLFLGPVSYALHMEKPVVLMLLVHAFGLTCINFLNAKNCYEFNAGKNLLLSLSLSVLTIAVSYLFIRQLPKETNYWGRISAAALVYGIYGVCITIWLLRNGKTFYNKTYWKFCIPLAAPLILHSLSNLVLDQCDRTMLQWMQTNSVVGIYSLAATFSGVLISIQTALSESWSPFFLEHAKNGESDKLRMRSKNYLELFTVLTLGFLLLTPEVYHLFASKEYWSGVNLIPLLSAGHYFVFLYGFPVMFEFYSMKTKYIAAGTLLASVCNVALNYLLISHVGIVGAAIATMLSHGVQFLFHHVSACRLQSNIPYPFPMKMIAPYGILILLAAVWMSQCTSSALFRWGLGVVLGVYELSRIIKRRSIF